jgi:hypothetical protein
MHSSLALAAFLLCVPLYSLSSQTEADRVRILAWYARLVGGSALAPHKVVFVLPDTAPHNPKGERWLSVLRRALQQADVPTITEGHAPGRDTIMILLGVPEPDSVAAWRWSSRQASASAAFAA